MATLYAVESEQSWSDTWYYNTGGETTSTLFTGGAAFNQNSFFDDIGIGGSVNLESNGEFTFADPGNYSVEIFGNSFLSLLSISA